MSRLIAFGCSITYGQGLPDCYVPPNNAGDKPSQYAWPSLLGKRLDKEVVNLGSPGSGNLEILYKLLQYKFQENDLCVIYWSFYNRIDLVRLKPNIDKIHRLNLEDIDKKFLSENGYKVHTELRNYMLIHHAALHLEKIAVPYFFLDRKVQYANVFTPVPSFLKVQNHDNTNMDITFRIDYALDHLHPGIQSQEKIANYMFNRITNTKSGKQ